MSSPITVTQHAGVALISLDNPPVNALSQAVRAGLQQAIERAEANPQITVLVIAGAGKTFCAGADIREFGKPPQAPNLPELTGVIERCTKPVIAAIHGSALGGGLEIALACHFRVAAPSAKLGLPEVKLGLLPGAGGTQRLPRLAGVESALEMIVEGNPIDADRALRIGLIDEVATGDLTTAAMDFANRVLTQHRPIRRTSTLTAHLPDQTVFARWEAIIAKKHRGLDAPLRCLEAVRAAAELPFAEGVAQERRLFVDLLASQQAKALRHAFFAEREASRAPGLPETTPTRSVASVAVIGAGTMGAGIAICFADAGLPVHLLEMSPDNLERGLSNLRKHYASSVSRGRLDRKTADTRLALIRPTLSYDDLSTADLIIEAVFEDMAVKQDVFRKLDTVAKDTAILATNTSYLDVDEIASATRRPQNVIGMHFFSPANVMKLLETVRASRTSPDVQGTAMKVGKAIGKISVLVGACDGFVGNRMLARRTREAYFLLEEGATPSQVDRVLVDFGFPMGPFAVGDLAGLDVGWRNRKSRLHKLTPREQACDILDQLCEQGRLGQKTGAGFYRYDAQRRPTADPAVEALIVQHSAKVGIQRRAIEDREILERCLYAMINEGARIIEEGIVTRPLEIDVVWLFGYGFPRHRGGPMFHADQVGLRTICDAITRYCDQLGREYWTPAPLLERLARENHGFYDTDTDTRERAVLGTR